jgi:hypothetical protein
MHFLGSRNNKPFSHSPRNRYSILVQVELEATLVAPAYLTRCRGKVNGPTLRARGSGFAVLAHRDRFGKREYLVQWEKCSYLQSTWEPAAAASILPVHQCGVVTRGCFKISEVPHTDSQTLFRCVNCPPCEKLFSLLYKKQLSSWTNRITTRTQATHPSP